MKTITSQASLQGNRDHQEDRSYINITENGLLLAIFDGHGGDEVAEFCKQTLPKAYNAMDLCPINMPIADRLRGIFDYLNYRTNHMDSGAAASIVFIPSTLDKAYVGILGDAPVIVKQADEQYWIAPEHNVRSNPNEVKLAKERGGVVYNGYLFPGRGLSSHGLQMSRALGDADLNSVLSREPEIFEIPLGAGSFVLVASDGVLDPHHNSRSAAESIVNLIEKGASADELVKYAAGVPTNDNATAVLVKIIKDIDMGNTL